MKVLHVTMNMKGGSGVVTFVREVDAALCEAGVESSVLVESDPLPARLVVDMVHIHGLWRPFFHHVCTLALRQGVPVVWSPHGMLAPWALRNKWFKKKLAWWLYQKRDLQQAAAIHVTSDLEAGWLARVGRPLIQIPLGTHLAASDADAQDLSTKRQHVLLYVGRVFKVKALDRLIQAWSRVPKAIRTGWQLRIVGPDEGEHLAELKRMVAQLQMRFCDLTEDARQPESEIVFVGPQFGADLAAAYRACDCLALVSHTENFGATVVDAFAHAKPVITSTKTPWKAVVEKGCGWWVDNAPDTLAQTLVEMMTLDEAVRVAMGQRGRQWAEEAFSWTAVGRCLCEAYQMILRSQNG